MNKSVAQPQAKADLQPEGKVTPSSDLTPQIAKRAYEIHEERGFYWRCGAIEKSAKPRTSWVSGYLHSTGWKRALESRMASKHPIRRRKTEGGLKKNPCKSVNQQLNRK
jgi:hypothetical protein